ncbi:MAG TPA: DNA methyltransferase, partial [Bryobacteraceae bacterium]|nr:DNA methyltransferase [Bryobacteraceae bacterium]
ATDHMDKKNCDTDGYVHPTQKPVALVRRAIENSSRAGDVVLDLFGGSGSTLVACEKTGRNARIMELDPRFIDVIVKRWQNFTGRTALTDEGLSFDEVLTSRRGRAR